MSRARPRKIPQRKRIFIGCEGASEASYCALINRLAGEAAGLHVHIVAHILQPGAGDPFALVSKAVDWLDLEERRRVPFAVKAVLLDRTHDRDKARRASGLADEQGIQLVWQEPDHEGFLLRHLPNCQQLRPPAGASLDALRREWPAYSKAMPMLDLARRLGLSETRAAAVVEPKLSELLLQIGFELDR